jgi:hypothetical protein
VDVRTERVARALEFAAGLAVGVLVGGVAIKSGDLPWALLIPGALAGAASLAAYNRIARTYTLGFLAGLALLGLSGLLFFLLVIVPNSGGT